MENVIFSLIIFSENATNNHSVAHNKENELKLQNQMDDNDKKNKNDIASNSQQKSAQNSHTCEGRSHGYENSNCRLLFVSKYVRLELRLCKAQ